ncbi:hypothetical protein AVEN_274243-1 [Araneus ventricosus]|uniref:PiggyBac transposable element-derived protein domain-containing protein n=1 Tax=Araneus ventricosus TaxID=182803 RepID=A0A4Y2VLP4_ARAVE|nr:hypothetical protein AVEN_274243-1 [Araneus ventricosus]
MQSVLDLFIANCKSNCCLSEYLTVDEMLVPLGHAVALFCIFRISLQTKEEGIFAFCDAKTHYTGNIKSYYRKQPDGPYQSSNCPADVVLRLVYYLKDTKRNLPTDNWYTNESLAHALL